LKVAVTGGTGCLGRPLVQKLLDNGIDVNLLLHPSEEEINLWQNKLTNIRGEINSTIALETLTRECDIVFHLAGKVHSIPKTKRDENSFYKVNQVGTENLLRAAGSNGVKRVVFFSTVGVYGKDSNFHGNEKSSCNPITAYSKSKYLAENIILESHSNYGPEGVVLRFPVVYGKFDRGNVASLIKAIYNKHFFYFGDGTCKRSMISSENVAEAAINAGLEPSASNELFVITDGQDYELKELVDSIILALNKNWQAKHIPLTLAKTLGKLGDLFEKVIKIHMPFNSSKVSKLSSSLTFSCEKAKQQLKYKPVVSLNDGIAEEVEWLKTQYSWK